MHIEPLKVHLACPTLNLKYGFLPQGDCRMWLKTKVFRFSEDSGEWAKTMELLKSLQMQLPGRHSCPWTAHSALVLLVEWRRLKVFFVSPMWKQAGHWGCVSQTHLLRLVWHLITNSYGDPFWKEWVKVNSYGLTDYSSPWEDVVPYSN